MTIMANQRTLEQILRDARSLPRPERARLIGLLAEELAMPTVSDPQSIDLRDLVAAIRQAGPWEGDDLEQRITDVYAARAPLSFEE